MSGNNVSQSSSVGFFCNKHLPVISFVLGCNDFFKKYKSVELGNQLANICNAKIHVLFHFGTLF